MLVWDRLKKDTRFSNPAIEPANKDLIPVLKSPDQLVGWDLRGARYANGVLDIPDKQSALYPVVASDIAIRARIKRRSGDHIAIYLRNSSKGRYGATFNGRSFVLGKQVGGKWTNMVGVNLPRSYDDFVDVEFAAMGNTLTLVVNGVPQLLARDSTFTEGDSFLGGVGSGLFKDVAILIPSEESLVADNRKLAGPYADPSAIDELYTRFLAKEPKNRFLTKEPQNQLLAKEPWNAALYAQRADLRARYEQKWSEAAEDMAEVIKLKPGDVLSWQRRTMLLVKLQQGQLPQKDLLAEHLATMLAKFQGGGVDGKLIQNLTAFPTGRQELIQAAEVLAGKLPNDPGSRFWAAIARFRAGKYEEAERLFSSAATDSLSSAAAAAGWRFQTPILQAYHAMIKARLNDREAASELLSRAKEAFKKEVLDDQGTEHGDYGVNWSDRLRTESLLAEAEDLIRGPKPLEYRTWHDKQNHSVEAMLVEHKGDDVRLRKRDGTNVTLSISKLSDEDVNWLGQQRK